MIATWESGGRKWYAHQECWAKCSGQLTGCPIAYLLDEGCVSEDETCFWCGHKVGARTAATPMIEEAVANAAKISGSDDVQLEAYANGAQVHVFVTYTLAGVPKRLASSVGRRENQSGFGVTCSWAGGGYSHKGFCSIEDAAVIFAVVSNLLSRQGQL